MTSLPAPYDYIFKYIVIGSVGVGKSCLLHRFTEHRFLADMPHTIGVEFGTKILEVDGHHVKLQIWDTAGQERFRAVTRSYYRGAAGALIVYDIARRPSFVDISKWLSDARSLVNPTTVFLLVGNKSDLKEEREVTFEEASKFAQENGLTFMETSAKTGENVEEGFLRTARLVCQAVADGSIDVTQSGSGIQIINTAAEGAQKSTCTC